MITGPQAREIGLRIVLENPTGIGPTEIGKKILAMHPDMVDSKGRPSGTIRGAVWDLDQKFPKQVRKTANGFAPVKGASAPEEAPCQNPRIAAANSAASAKQNRTNAASAETSSVTTAATAPTQPSSAASGATRTSRTGTVSTAAGPVLTAQSLREAEDALRLSFEREADGAQLRISALEEAIAQAHGKISELESLLSKANTELLQSKRREHYRIGLAHEPERIGVVAEAQNAGVLIDIRQAVLAGSDEDTLAAVRRVVDDLAKVRTQLALTGISDDAKRLKAARKAAGVLQKDLGNNLGYSGRSVIDLIERGMVPLSKHEKVLAWVQKIEAKYDPVRH